LKNFTDIDNNHPQRFICNDATYTDVSGHILDKQNIVQKVYFCYFRLVCKSYWLYGNCLFYN